MSESGVRVQERRAALVAVIDRPAAKNAIARETAKELERFVQRASDDERVRAAIITGSGVDVFVAGGDLRDFDELSKQALGAQEVLDMGAVVNALESCAVPTIAAVQGAAYGGGCELALACDLVVVEQHATFSFRQAAMGLSTGWGGGVRLVERVGPMHAAQLLLLGDRVDAVRARKLGLAAQVVPKGTSLDQALAWTERIARLPRASVAGIKRMLRDVRHEHRGDALRKEAEVFASLWGKADHLAAMEAFFRR
ncbi:MAG: enoyl-CoA hydratase/isomerase family protein [Myxococcota bacterium]